MDAILSSSYSTKKRGFLIFSGKRFSRKAQAAALGTPMRQPTPKANSRRSTRLVPDGTNTHSKFGERHKGKYKRQTIFIACLFRLKTSLNSDFTSQVRKWLPVTPAYCDQVLISWQRDASHTNADIMHFSVERLLSHESLNICTVTVHLDHPPTASYCFRE